MTAAVHRCGVRIGVFTLFAAATLAHAHAEVPPPTQGLAFVPQTVRYPWPPAAIGRIDARPGGAARAWGRNLRGPLVLDRQRGFALELEALDIVRVRTIPAGSSARLRCARLPADGTGLGFVEEAGLPVDGESTYLVQPPGPANVWLIWADGPTTVMIERPVALRARTAWEHARHDILSWIEGADRAGSRLPDVPQADGRSGFVDRLIRDRAVQRALARMPGYCPEVDAAVIDLRKAKALAGWAQLAPHRFPYFKLDAVDGRFAPSLLATVELAQVDPEDEDETAGEGASRDVQPPSARPWRRIVGPSGRFDVRIDGPGWLEIETRAVFPVPVAGPASAVAPPPVPARAARILVTSEGRALADQPATLTPALVPVAPPEAAPFRDRIPLLTTVHEPASFRTRVRVPLWPGSHGYQIEVTGGPVLLRAVAAYHQPRLREDLSGPADVAEFLDRAEHRLARRPALDPAVRAARDLLTPLRAPAAGTPLAATGASDRAAFPPLVRAALEVEELSANPSSAALARGTPVILSLLASVPGSAVDPEAHELASRLRAELGTLLMTAALPDLARRVLRAGPLPPAAALPVFSRAIPPDPVWGKSRAVAAVERALAAHPSDGAVAERYREIWRESSRWSSFAPSDQGGGGNDGDENETTAPLAAEPFTFLQRRVQGEGAAVATQADRLASNLLFPVSPAALYRINAPVSAFDGRRAALWRVYVRTPSATPGPLPFAIDGKPYHALALSAVELLEFAVSPGPHELQRPAAVPPGLESAELFSSLPLLDREGQPIDPRTGGGATYLRTFWPIAQQGKPLRFTIPDPDLGGPVRIQFRMLQETPAGATITLHTDLGPTQRFLLGPTPIDPDIDPIAAPSRLSHELSFVLNLPPQTRAIWFSSPAGAKVVATVAVRVPLAEEPAPASAVAGLPSSATPAPDAGIFSAPPELAGLDRVHGLSRALALRPEEPELLLARAATLLDLDEGGEARQDVLRTFEDARLSSRFGPDAQVTLIRQGLIDNFSAWIAPTHVRGDPGETRVVPLRPALLALPGPLPPFAVAAARTARTRGPGAALAGLPSAPNAAAPAIRDYLRARLLAATGDAPAAARAFLDLGAQAGLAQAEIEAMEPTLAALQETRPRGLAARAFAAATRLAQRWKTVMVARVLTAAAHQSQWRAIRRFENSGGYEQLSTDQSLGDLSPPARIRLALSASPWPVAETQLVTDEEGAILDVVLTRAAAVSVQAFCVRHRDPRGVIERCPLRIRADNLEPAAHEVPLAQITALPAVTLPPGPHRLEVTAVPRADGARVLTVVRFLSDRALQSRGRQETVAAAPALPIQSPSRWAVAGPGKPIVVSLLGPSVVRVEARRAFDLRPGTVHVAARTTGPGPPIEATFALATSADARALSDRGDGLLVGAATEQWIVLPDAVPYDLSVSADPGSALVRLSARDDREGVEPPAAPISLLRLTPARDAHLAWSDGPLDLLIDAPAQAPVPLPRWPTWSAELLAGRETLDDRDGLNEPRADFVALSLEWRRRLEPRRIFVHAEGTVRERSDDGAPTFGGGVGGYVRDLPGDLRFYGGAQGFTQSVLDGHAWSVRGDLTATRYLSLGPARGVLPFVAVRARHYNLPPLDARRIANLDPFVYSVYGSQHRFAATAGATGLWFPWQDQMISPGLRFTTNPDLGSLDYLQADFLWRGLIELFGSGRRITDPMLDLLYRPSYRFADDHRAQGFWLHQFTARLLWTAWTGASGRVVFGLWNDVYLTSGRPTRDSLRFGLRYDLTGGRFMRDFSPQEDDFSELIEGRRWEPVP